jgi:GWxTD domain-containing protein
MSEREYLCGMNATKLGTAASWLLICWLGLTTAHAQAPIACDVLRFQSLETAFLEVHVDFESRLFYAVQSEDGWHTRVQVEAVVESPKGIVNYGKTNIDGPFGTDSLAALDSRQFHLERITVPPGAYNVTITIRDQSGKGVFEETTSIPVEFMATDAPAFSDPFIVEAFAASASGEPTNLTRSGYEMLPLVQAELSIEATKLQFYTELYKADEVVDSLFLVQCWLESENGSVLPSTRRFFRKEATAILPVFTSIPLTDVQKTQRATLVVQALTRNNELIAENFLPLQFVAPNSSISLAEFGGSLPAYLAAFTDSTTLQQHIRDHHPKADASQRKTIDGFLEEATVPQMQAFLAYFWEQQAPANPELGWRTYTTAIAYADSAYGACRQGHGAETDMGYIYLRYGPPNTIVKRHNETDYYPYEIWHYHRAGPFTNKRFLFFSPHMVAECFTLLHSDMLGEVSNNDWLQILRSRENTLRVTSSQLNRLNPRRDTFSGEEPEDLFFNPR